MLCNEAIGWVQQFSALALFDRHWDESNSGPRCCTNYDYLHVGNRKVRMKLRQPVHRYQPWENIIIKLD
jgi:hypothetical protein